MPAVTDLADVELEEALERLEAMTPAGRVGERLKAADMLADEAHTLLIELLTHGHAVSERRLAAYLASHDFYTEIRRYLP